jgi:hypothetical protein
LAPFQGWETTKSSQPARKLKSPAQSQFWQRRYYDFNVFTANPATRMGHPKWMFMEKSANSRVGHLPFDVGDWAMYAAKHMCKAAGF